MAKEHKAQFPKTRETRRNDFAPLHLPIFLQPPPRSPPLKAMLLRSHLRPKALLFPSPKPDTLMFGSFYV